MATWSPTDVRSAANQIAAHFGVQVHGHWRDRNAPVTPGRSPTSLHYDGLAIDFSGPPGAMANLANWARSTGFFGEVMFGDRYHGDHVHVGWGRNKSGTLKLPNGAVAAPTGKGIVQTGAPAKPAAPAPPAKSPETLAIEAKAQELVTLKSVNQGLVASGQITPAQAFIAEAALEIEYLKLRLPELQRVHQVEVQLGRLTPQQAAAREQTLSARIADLTTKSNAARMSLQPQAPPQPQIPEVRPVDPGMDLQVPQVPVQPQEPKEDPVARRMMLFQTMADMTQKAISQLNATPVPRVSMEPFDPGQFGDRLRSLEQQSDFTPAFLQRTPRRRRSFMESLTGVGV